MSAWQSSDYKMYSWRHILRYSVCRTSDGLLPRAFETPMDILPWDSVLDIPMDILARNSVWDIPMYILQWDRMCWMVWWTFCMEDIIGYSSVWVLTSFTSLLDRTWYFMLLCRDVLRRYIMLYIILYHYTLSQRIYIMWYFQKIYNYFDILSQQLYIILLLPHVYMYIYWKI